jgi:hypothetical protein
MEIQRPVVIILYKLLKIIEKHKIKYNSLTQTPKHASFGFLKLMLQRRITLNFKNNLMERAYIL